jgi:hypothetical protein
MTAEEARQCLEARNGGPMDGAIVDLILNTLGTRVIDLMNLLRVLKAKINDTKQVEMYLQTKISDTMINVNIAIGSHPKMLDLLMELDRKNELRPDQAMDILGVSDFNTLKSMKSLLARTWLISFDRVENKLTFDGPLVRKAFTEWKKEKKGRCR